MKKEKCQRTNAKKYYCFHDLVLYIYIHKHIYIIIYMFYNNVSTGIDSFGLSCCFKNISDVGKPLKITHLQPKVVSRFTKRNMKLIQRYI